MSTTDLQREWLIHQRTMAQVLPRLVEDARAAAASESSTPHHVDSASPGRSPQSAQRPPRRRRRAPRRLPTIKRPPGTPTDPRTRPPARRAPGSDQRGRRGGVARENTLVADDSPATIRAVDAVLDRIERHLNTAYRFAMEIANDDLGDGD